MIPAQVRIDPEHVQESLLGHGQEGVVLTHLDRDGPLGEQLSCSLFKTRWWPLFLPQFILQWMTEFEKYL